MPKEIGIIGGTGIYSEGMLKNVRVAKIRTPYGKPSSDIRIGDFKGKKIAFLFRHGDSHSIPPHKVNSHANIHALEKLGVERIIAIAAVGSLQKKIKPGDIVIPDQFIDFTKHRKLTFYDGPKVAHISMADPFCGEMRKLACKKAKLFNIPFHEKGTYLCIEGPRFSTRAESNLWRIMKADIIGMTLIPEVVLAMEKELCYLSVTSVTDYDCWKAKGSVSADDVIRTMKKNTENIKKILETLIPSIPEERACACGKALENAFL